MSQDKQLARADRCASPSRAPWLFSVSVRAIRSPQRSFPNLGSFRQVDAESEIAFSKKDETFQESQGILSPLRLSIPPRPRRASATAHKMNRRHALPPCFVPGRNCGPRLDGCDLLALFAAARPDHARQIKHLAHFPAKWNERKMQTWRPPENEGGGCAPRKPQCGQECLL
jgi:hypothetical protein